ncbi:hypothetical protein UFOVP67_38 [uncultured Caudovirales phage]|uniref:Uncharacterized protein n=1 Tax=uncultured Caudovirales phage TaxID=2100421 RepID=A0A6J5T979_9CAUD|nr:hypothetical protein UFOVP67_38 [uncultured Caudovirales phage]
MKQTVKFSDFCDAFKNMGRGDQFTYEGKRALFDYLEEVDEDYELDVIALCCDYTEADYEQIISEHDIDIGDAEENDVEQLCREFLEENTVIIGEVTGGFIYANF